MTNNLEDFLSSDVVAGLPRFPSLLLRPLNDLLILAGKMLLKVRERDFEVPGERDSRRRGFTGQPLADSKAHSVSLLRKVNFSVGEAGSVDFGVHPLEHAFRREAQATGNLLQRRRRTFRASPLESAAHLFTLP
jgi:hypothetical protein